MKYLITFIFLNGFLLTNAQFLEFGGGLGGFNYSGDLIRGYQLTNTKPGISVHHRMNWTDYLSLRWTLTGGWIEGSDIKPIDAFSDQRDFKFRITAIELSSLFEYHFLDYKHDKSPIRWSPYVFMGVAFIKMYKVKDPKEDFNRIQPALPIGIGFKHLIGKRFSASAEIGARKVFFDYLDNISDGDLAIKNYQYGNPNDNDWYYFTGISISYIIYKIPCPFPYVPNNSILKH